MYKVGFGNGFIVGSSIYNGGKLGWLSGALTTCSWFLGTSLIDVIPPLLVLLLILGVIHGPWATDETGSFW